MTATERAAAAPGGHTAGRGAIALAIVVVAVTVVGAVLMWANQPVVYGNDYFLGGLFTVTSGAYTVAGVAIVRRAPTHVIGWLCLGIALALQIGLALTQYGIYAIVSRPGALPGPDFALVLGETTPFLVLTGIILIIHLFPTGRPVAPRWRLAVAATIVAQVLGLVGLVLSPHQIVDIWSDELSHAGATASNPLGVAWFASISDPVDRLAAALYLIGVAGAVVGLFVRRRRATGEERLQIRWLAAVAGGAVAWIVLMAPFVIASSEGLAGAIFWLVATPLVALGPPAAIGIGIVKYRLFDIDVVIRKTVVVTVVAFTLTGVYLAVLGLATVGRLSRLIVGLALLAVTFAPVLRAARAIADRVAYGRRATSYEVLADFSDRMADTYAADDVLPRMAAILVGATGARTATVWLRVGQTLQPAATAGEPLAAQAVPIVGDTVPRLPGDASEVRHQGELLGAVSVSMPPNDPLDESRAHLIRDLASQAGLVLRNVRLIEELRASRQRLVAAQDAERRRIERNIHDGVQQQLVALNVQLGLLGRVARTDASKVGPMATELQTRATEALEDLRDLARGIYPPLLADRGLADALQAQAQRAAVPTTVVADGLERYSPDVESAVYFCVLEALNNIAKYADASNATVRLEQTGGVLRFDVEDDGAGFDPAGTGHGTGLQGMADRLDAIGGTLTVRSAPGAGTTVSGAVPMRSDAQAVAASQADSSRSGPNDDLGM